MLNDLVGRQIQGYEIGEMIGQGGFGGVYRAYQTSVEREVAIKMILPKYANHPDFVRRFQTEVQLVARLEHPHIVPLIDFWRDPDGAYLVMRLLRGGSLKEYLLDTTYMPEQAAQMLDQIAGALAVAHRNQIIHRDIKPANILLDEDGNTYLTDFGIAKDLTNPDSITHPGTIVGSPDYIAPEQATDGIITIRTDIYSLGVTLYESLTGEHPFPDSKGIERVSKHVMETLPSLHFKRPELPAALNDVIQKATAKDPTDRYGDVLEFAQAFRKAITQPQRSTAASLYEALTQREMEVLQKIAEGLSNREIADELFLAVSTVKWYVRQIYSKLDVKNRRQALLRANELNLFNIAEAIASGDPIEVVQATPSPTHTQPIDIGDYIENPYKGLQAFQSADAQNFYGREALVQTLLNRLLEEDAHNRFLALVGPSGIGKSSVVKAGLIPALQHGALPDSEKWFVIEIVPGAYPLEELEIALVRIAVNPPENLLSQLREDERGLLRASRRILPDNDSQLLIVIDQFEELFTMVQDEAERQHFLNSLLEAVSDANSQVRIVVTLRADFYDRPLAHPQFGHVLQARMETVLPLLPEEFERAINRPAEKAGLTLEAGLTPAIIAEISGQPGALPLLQYALTELFERRDGRMLTLAAYEDMGGALGALAARAEMLYSDLEHIGHAEIVRQLFLRLVTMNDHAEATRRRVAIADLTTLSDSADAVEEIIDIFGGYRLLTFDHDPINRAPTVEIAHEALIASWERMHKWIMDSREYLRLQRRLSVASRDWQLANRDPSYLLTGTRLLQFESWQQETDLTLNQSEIEYLNNSLAARDEHLQAEASRQKRELTLQQQAASRLRYLVAGLVIFSLVAGALALFAIDRQAQAVAEAENAQQQTIIAERNATEAQSLALAANAQLALNNGDMDSAIAFSIEANRIDDPGEIAQKALFSSVYAPGTERVFAGHSNFVTAVTYRPNHQMALSSAMDSTMRLWDLTTGEELQNHTFILKDLELEFAAFSLAFSPDGKFALAGTATNDVHIWDVEAWEEVELMSGHEGAVSALDFNHDGTQVLSGGWDGTLILWDFDRRFARKQFLNPDVEVTSVMFSPDDSQLAAAYSDPNDDSEVHYVIIWDVQSGEEVRRLDGHVGSVTSIDWSRDGQHILTGSTDRSLILWDAVTGEQIRQYQGHSAQIGGVALRPDGQTIISTAWDNSLIIWDMDTGERISEFQGHSGGIPEFALSPNGLQAITGSMDHSLRLWDLEGSLRIRTYVGHTEAVSRVAVSPDGKTMLSGSNDDTLILWDVRSGAIIRRFVGHEEGIWRVAVSPDGRYGLSGAYDPAIILWDLATGQIIHRITEHTDDVSGLAFLPDGKSFITTSFDTTIRHWNMETGELIKQFNGMVNYLTGAVVDHDGKILATSGLDGLQLWDIESGERIADLNANTGEGFILLLAVAFSPDGRYVAGSSSDGTIIIWDVDSQTRVHDFTGHIGAVRTLAFSPDSTLLLSGSDDKTMILWNIATGTELARYQGHTEGVNGVVFSPDGQSIFSASLDNTLAQWRIPPSVTETIEWAQANRYIRELTCTERERFQLLPLCGVS